MYEKSHVRIPIGLLLEEVITTEFIRCSFIFFVASVTVSDGEHVGTLQKVNDQRKPQNLNSTTPT